MLSLNTFLGNAQIVDILRRAIRLGRVPHAMIFAGPAGVGKCTLGVLFAQYLNCLSPSTEGACGHCSVCRRIMAVIQSRQMECLSPKGEVFCGVCPNCRLRAMRHADVRLIEPEKTTISIDQIRDLIGEIAFQPFEARYRIVILDPADQMRLEAHNSLLKTLEEPASRTIMILVTVNQYMLPETIRSRSRLLQFGLIPQDQIEKRLMATEQKSADEAALAAALGGGSLGSALAFNTTDFREIRKQSLRFAALLLTGQHFAEVSAIAASMANQKESFQLYVECLEVILQDVYYAKMAAERIGQRDLRKELEGLARAVPRSTVVSAIQAIARLKNDLRNNVARQLALEAGFLSLVRNQPVV